MIIPNLFASILKSQQSILGFFISHFSLLAHHFDPIKPPKNNANKNVHHCYILLITIYTLLFGAFGLHFESSSDELDFSKWPQNPYIATHQISHPSVWLNFDIIFGLIFWHVITITIVILFNPDVDKESKIKLCDRNILSGGFVLNQTESVKIISFYKIIQTFVRPGLLLFCLCVLTNFYVQLLYNGVYKVSVMSILFWFYFFPSLLFYLMYSKL